LKSALIPDLSVIKVLCGGGMFFKKIRPALDINEKIKHMGDVHIDYCPVAIKAAADSGKMAILLRHPWMESVGRHPNIFIANDWQDLGERLVPEIRKLPLAASA
jgi:hypothetical protein